jgi:hypothetical protein
MAYRLGGSKLRGSVGAAGLLLWLLLLSSLAYFKSGRWID